MKFKQIRCFRCYPSFSITIHICFQINILLNVLPEEVPTTKFRVSPEDSTELFRAESISVSRLLAVPELEDVADVLDVAVVVVEKQLSFDIFFIKKVFYFCKVFFQSRFICLWKFEYQQKGTNFFCGEKTKLRTEESLVGQDVLLLRLSVLLDIHQNHFTTNTFSHLRQFFSSLKIWILLF